MSASQQVFSTYELIEAILLHLDMASILKAQRLSKSVKSVIDRSIPIQQRLFLSPITVDGNSKRPVPRINALALNYIYENITQLELGTCRSSECLSFEIRYPDRVARLKHMRGKQHESWHLMLAVQPPVELVYILTHHWINHGTFYCKEQRLGPVMNFFLDQDCESDSE
ncbi:hypothetical protein M8818_000990 [Zalaria obscura]|uniref:Uncharacterized protein n=1 Tax=Zalaria obscura TaxID=2024903 RepID=A0ACC3SNE3_9PEZI